MQVQPPPSLPKNKQPFLRIIMPVVMVIAVTGMIAVTFLSGGTRNPTSLVFPLMMLGSLAMMVQPGGQDVDEIRRSYHRHLDALGDVVRCTRREQQENTWRRHPDPGALWTWVPEGVDTEPGVARIGIAVQAPEDPLEVSVDVPPEDLEPVCAMSLRDVVSATDTVEAPVAVDLREFPVVAVTGQGAGDLVRAIQGALVLQDPTALTIHGPHDRWLPHDGPIIVSFHQGSCPALAFSGAGRCSVIADADDVVQDAAREQGLLLYSDAGVLSAWTVDGWRPFATADHLSDVELSALCRARCTQRQETSFLDLPGGGLRAPIGFNGQSPVHLDIREAARGGIGPHGLCIGATGSGKSELLKSVVTSFAHHHPAAELNFILVDFKGGAAFAGMERLPHTSAVITNLSEEASLVERMKDALLGEMHRRQQRLRTAGESSAVEYNLRFPGAMPSLLIVVDEFSELLHERPEFAEVFAAIGRLGRSLGLHLLLASQRFEEGRLRGLESHLSYRIVLRTFSAVESRALIGSTAAHELPAQPGAAILTEASGTASQIRFQSAYVSGPEVPSDLRIVREIGVEPEAVASTMDTVLDRLAGPNMNPVWLPPLPKSLPASHLLGSLNSPANARSLVAPVGLEDLPFDGVQRPFVIDLRRRHWAIVGSPGTGKTFLLRTLAIALTLTSPGVDIYIVDPGGSLAELARIPQVVAVVGVDQIDRLFGEVFRPASDDLLHRVLLVDGIDALGEQDRRLATLIAGALEHGIHVVVTALRWTFRPSLRDLLDGQVELRLPLSDSNHREARRALPDVPGRGISPAGRHVQFAMSDAEAVEHARLLSVQRGEPERTMRLFPQLVLAAELPQSLVRTEVAMGLGGPDLEPVSWDWSQDPHLTIVGQARSGATTALRTIVSGIGQRSEEVHVLATDIRRGLLGVAGYCTLTDFRREIDRWITILRDRVPENITSLSPEALRARSWWTGPELFVVVDDLDHSPDLATAMEILIPLLPHAADIGLHLVTARRSASMARSSFTPLLQGIRDTTAWLLLAAPREDGPVAGRVLRLRQPGRGEVVTPAGLGCAVELQVAVIGGEQ